MADEPEQELVAQFPAPSVGGERDPVEAGERLEPPTEEARRVMAAHMRKRHGIQRFRVDRYVYLGPPPRKPSQHLTWMPLSNCFTCDLCDGWVFGCGGPTDLQIWHEQLWNDSLREKLSGLNAEERDLMTRMSISGDLARAELNAAAEIAYQAEVARSRPQVDARRERLQAHMLNRYAELGVVHNVITETYELQFDDPERWQQLAGRQLAQATIKNYWDAIPAARKLIAKRRYAARQR